VLDRPFEELLSEARRMRSKPVVTHSPKVFIPLTKLCRDVCHYCTFARPPRRGERAYLTPDEVLDIARAGRAAGRVPRQRTTLYGAPPPERTAASFGAPPLAEPLNPPVDTSRLRRPKVLVRPGLAVA
jgi:2-iminoacetate synthase ThiH